MRIHLPAETWVEIFAWLKRREFAKKMEQLWDREFSPIAEKWLHEWSKGIKIGSLVYHKIYDAYANQAKLCRVKGRYWWPEIPIAEVDMPKNICSFEKITISHLDNTVLAFLRRMRPLLLSNVHLRIESYRGLEKVVPIALEHLLPMFSGGDEFESVKLGNKEIPLLNDARYSPALLNTKMLVFWGYDNSFTWLTELLANWLFTKRADGQPRMLVLSYENYYEILTNLIQERFMAATTAEEAAFPFVVRFENGSEDVEFNERTIENGKNGQQLIMRKASEVEEASSDKDIVFISCPLDAAHEQLTEWEQKAFDPDVVCSFNREFLLCTTLGPLDPIDQYQQQQQHQQPGSSEKESNAPEQPGTSKMLLKRWGGGK